MTKLQISDTNHEFIVSKDCWDWIKKSAKGKERIIDFGCGTGTLLYNLMKISESEVYGLDLSKSDCELSREFTKCKNIICDNALNTPFKNGFFDLITCTMLIEHVDDKKLLKEINRCLKPNGILILSTVLKDEGAKYFYKNANGEFVLEPSHLREYTSIKPLFELCTTNGFEVKDYNITPIRFSPMDKMFRLLYSLFPFKFIKSFVESSIIQGLRLRTRILIPKYHCIELLLEKNNQTN